MTVHFFQVNPHDSAVRLVANEELVLEWAELAARKIAGDPTRGLTHLWIREINRGRFQLRDFFGFHHHAAAAGGLLRHGTHLVAVPPAETIGMPFEIARGEVLQRTSAIPGALI